MSRVLPRTIQVNKNAPIVIIDCSYLVFHRLFATQKWWSFANAASTADPPRLNNPDFCKAFLKHLNADISKLQKRWGLVKGRGASKINAPQNMIFAQDCKRDDIWRMELYPEYKGTRQINVKFDPTAFPTCLTELAKHQEVGGLQIVSHPKLEADDVAALLFKQIRASDPTHPITFITGDHDYLQLKDEHTQIFGLPDKDLYEAGVKKGTNDLQRKIVQGDSSDNIPPVLKTKKHVDAFMETPLEERPAFLAGLGPGIKEAFELNTTLMCWSSIPSELTESFNNTWKVEIQ